MRRRQGRVVVRVSAHAAAIVLLYLVLSLALFPGLQVEPLYGDIGLAMTAVLVAAYVYFGLIRRK